MLVHAPGVDEGFVFVDGRVERGVGGVDLKSLGGCVSAGADHHIVVLS
jgi:hypothetical protein